MEKQQTALVTGAAGFVGRHMVKHLVTLGYKVTGIDNMSSASSMYPGLAGDISTSKWPKQLRCNFNFINTDIKTFFQHYSAEQFRFDLVVHLAAVVGGRVMIENAPLAVAEDLAIDALMFDWATKTKPGKIIYASSSAAYPIEYQKLGSDCKLSEDMINFDNGFIGVADMSYGWSKLTGEFLSRLAHEKHNLDVVCYRPFSGYGEDQHETYPFPAILQRALNKENPLTIWSDTVRDFIHIEDCITGILTTMDKISDGSAINLGTGVPTSFSELTRTMASIIGYEPEIVILDDKPKGVHFRVSSTTKAESLGFKATTTLTNGIIRAIEMRGEKNV